MHTNWQLSLSYGRVSGFFPEMGPTYTLTDEDVLFGGDGGFYCASDGHCLFNEQGLPFSLENNTGYPVLCYWWDMERCQGIEKAEIVFTARSSGGPFPDDLPSLRFPLIVVPLSLYLDSKNPPGCPSPTVGNPVNVLTGNKFATEVDLPKAAGSPLYFARHYNSAGGYHVSTQFGSLSLAQKPLGLVWSHNYYQGLGIVSDAEVRLVRGNSQTFTFRMMAGIWKPDADVNYQLEELKTGTERTGWKVTTDDDVVENYNVNGDLLEIIDHGIKQTLSYSDGKLAKVTDPVGRELNFTYYANGMLESVTDPEGNIIRYEYENYRLVKVSYPDNTPANNADNPKKTYIYGATAGEMDNTANIFQPYALTGIIDENGVRYATYTYDASGRAISTEHAGGVSKYTLSYADDGSTRVWT